MKMLDQLKAARRVSTPLIFIKSFDAQATASTLAKEFKQFPVIEWDAVNGARGVNAAGKSAVSGALGDTDASATGSPVSTLQLAGKLPQNSLLVMFNLQLFLKATGDDNVALLIQAIMNHRDIGKSERVTIVMIGPDVTLPAELQQDVLVLSEPLPDDAALAEIVQGVYKDAQLDAPKKEIVERAVDALRGLAAFPADQVTAMSLTKNGVQVDEMWERKRQLIAQAPGLSVYRGDNSFDAIGGCAQIKKFLKQTFSGKDRPRAVVWIDEIDKHMAGSQGGDLSGVKSDLHGVMLTRISELKNCTGMLFYGPPGSAKSAMAKSAGNFGGVPCISMDIAGMQRGIVGESGQNIRRAWDVVEAVSGGSVLIVGTCNGMATLSPELSRRFPWRFVFDLPNAEERPLIWKIHMDRFGLKKQALPDDRGWTGAEIEQCCKMADKMNLTLMEAGDYIVPISTTRGEEITALRKAASGKFLDASRAGKYRYDSELERATTGRQIELQ